MEKIGDLKSAEDIWDKPQVFVEGDNNSNGEVEKKSKKKKKKKASQKQES